MDEEGDGAVVTPSSPLPRKASRRWKLLKPQIFGSVISLKDSGQHCFRSSMATARRMSRASGMGVGIPLPDLLSTIPGPEEGSVQERLEKMVNLVVNSTIRLPAHALV